MEHIKETMKHLQENADLYRRMAACYENVAIMIQIVVSEIDNNIVLMEKQPERTEDLKKINELHMESLYELTKNIKLH